MAFFQLAKGVSGLLGGNGFSSIANVLTIAGSVYTIASEIYAHVNGDGTFSPVEEPAVTNEEVLAEVNALRDDINELETALTELIISEFSGLQQQLLASAKSRATSALDLLSSYTIDPDIDRGEIIADASRALRDALAQAQQMLEPSDPPTALNAVKAAVGAVAYTLYVRMEVARELEGDEIASDKISRQIDDVMTFFDDVVDYVLTRITAHPIGEFRTEAYLDGAPFPDFYSAGFDEIEGRGGYGYYTSPFIFDPALATADDHEGPYEVSTNNYYVPSLDRVITLFSGDYYDSAGNVVPSTHPEARSGSEVFQDEMDAWVLEQTLQWFGLNRAELAVTTTGFRDLTDGEQFVAPSIPGFENDATIIGTDGNDLIIGNDGHDLLQGEGDPDLIRGMEGNDTVQGGTGGDRLEGNEGDDLLEGGDDNDALIGGPGDDTIDGGDGLDLSIYYGKRSEYVVTSYLDAGIRHVQVDGPEGTDTLTNVERLVFDNRTVQIQSGGGGPWLIGDILFEDGTRRVADDLMFLTGIGFARGVGGLGEDTISALTGIDTVIEGGRGNDLLKGSWNSFQDPYSMAVFNGARGSYRIHVTEFGVDPIIEVSGPDGFDILTGFNELTFADMAVGIVRAKFNFSTFQVEGGIGSDNDDIVIGTVTAAYLEGGGRNDTILAGSGNDTIHGGSTAPGPDGSDLIQAGEGDDLVWGDAGNDTILGQQDDDILNGGMGLDVLDGGSGSDTASYEAAWGGLIADLQFPAMNTGEAKGDTYISIENLRGSAFADSLRGDQFDNVLNGGEGDDTLIGRDGNDILSGDLGRDRLIGGAGTDTACYLTSDAGVIADLGTPAANTGDARGDTYSSVENILGSTWGDALRGNHLGNHIQGLGGDDAILGRQGDDTIDGGAGDDALRGDGGNDILRGDAGEDLLIGGVGRDYLTGGADADCFAFASVADLGIGAMRDQILDFEQGLDMISVAAVAPGVFDFRGTNAFAASGNAELRLLETATGSTIVQFDVDGNGTTDAELRIANVTGLTAGDFVL